MLPAPLADLHRCRTSVSGIEEVPAVDHGLLQGALEADHNGCAALPECVARCAFEVAAGVSERRLRQPTDLVSDLPWQPTASSDEQTEPLLRTRRVDPEAGGVGKPATTAALSSTNSRMIASSRAKMSTAEDTSAHSESASGSSRSTPPLGSSNDA
jgi:hypothetical protein